jgi:hypothetical protein
MFMDQNMRYVLILGRLATLNKKNWADYEQVFSCFHEQIKCCFFLKVAKNFFFELFLAKSRLNIHNQLCIAVIETPPCATSTVNILESVHFWGGLWAHFPGVADTL